MDDSAEAFLNHLGRYRLSLVRIAEQHFFGERTKAVLTRLRKEELIRIRNVGHSPTGFSYLQLTVAEARRRSVPEYRAKVLQAEAFHKSLATLWFCMCGPHDRVRLEPHEYPSAIVGPPPTRKEPLCIENAPGGPCVARIIVPGSASGLEHTVRTIREEAAALLRHPVSHRALQDGKIRFVVLVELESRREHAQDVIARERIGPMRSISIDVDLAPGPATLQAFLQKR